MGSNEALIPVQQHGWQRGFSNLFRAEMSGWWKTRRWWVQSIIWLAVVNGILALTMWTEGNTPDPSLLDEGLELFTIFSGIFVSIGTVIIMQSVIVGEKNSGTAAWVMSKPITRTAYILAKLISNMIGIVMIALVLQSVVAYVQLSAASGAEIPLGRFAVATAILGLHLLFYLTLTLFLGTVFDTRLPVIGIPIGFAMLQQFIIGLAPEIMVHVLPTTLALPMVDSSAALEVINGVPLTFPIAIYSTIGFVLLFSVLAVWRFSRQEF